MQLSITFFFSFLRFSDQFPAVTSECITNATKCSPWRCSMHRVHSRSRMRIITVTRRGRSIRCVNDSDARAHAIKAMTARWLFLAQRVVAAVAIHQRQLAPAVVVVRPSKRQNRRRHRSASIAGKRPMHVNERACVKLTVPLRICVSTYRCR